MARTFNNADKITVSNDASLNSNPFTINIHLNKGGSDVDAAFNRILFKSNQSDNGFVMLTHSDKRPYFIVYNTAGTSFNTYSLMPTLPVNTGKWYTLTFLSTGDLEVWVDGVSQGTVAFSGSYSASGADLIFGRSSASQDLNSLAMSEFSYVRAIMTDEQIKALHSGVRINRLNIPFGCYLPFVGNSSPEPDLSGEGNNGAITSGTGTFKQASVGRYAPAPKYRPPIVLSVGLTAVSRIFNIRHDISQEVGRTFNIRSDILNLVNRVFNLRHDILILVNRPFNIRHDIAQLVSRQFNLRHDLAGVVNRVFNLRHDISQFVNRNFAVRHDILNLVNRQFNIRHDIFQLVSRTFNLRHDLAGTVSRIFNLRHDLAGTVGRIFNIRSDILNSVNRAFTIRHDILILVGRTFNVRHDILQFVNRVFNLRHDLSGAVSRTFNLRHDIFGLISGGQTIPFGDVKASDNVTFGNVKAQDSINFGDAKG